MPTVQIASLNGWEVLLVMAAILVLFGSRRLPDLLKAVNSGSAEELAGAINALWQDFTVWFAQGFGFGLIPVGPGTFGSLIGVVWFLVLISSGNLWIYIAGILLGVTLSVWACGAAERTLQQTDPGSVVLDEIVAVPLCFAGWVGSFYANHGGIPAP